jgi:FtsP/CotA-like multicopper oxidase with cupredoxin domain
MASTHLYHDHAMGLTRLNSWAGLFGGYIISDPDSPVEQMQTTCDIPLIISDIILSTEYATLLYPTNKCALEDTKWVPESYGTVNAVNGIVMPFLNVPQQQCRLRLMNGANSRNFGVNMPFFDKCQVIASDMGLVNSPYSLSSASEVLLYPLERIELMVI